ncbi:MAG: Gfo/Idh/MocA family oxidoreductase [Acidimicrobiia bacterium]|nr:Gfo/Idh/MocA family oxidoreductase [Acidimicrobiia bacterium]
MEPLRIGTLGAARITPSALIKPARIVDGVEVVAVAARDEGRARSFAAKHDIARTFDSYAALIADPDIDAVYNPLPNGLHGEWTKAALRAGKHVLCEKPFTANRAEAEDVSAAADASGLVVMEAFHYRYHPVAAMMVDVVRRGEIGELRHVESSMCIPLPLPKDIRYRLDLAGGATMDTGCYALHMNRLVAGEEPDVVSATARLARPAVDRWMRAELQYPSGVTGRMTCALWSSTLLKVSVRAVGSEGELRVFNPTGPQFGYRMSVRRGGSKQRIRVDGAKRPTYAYQLDAFAGAVRGAATNLTPPSTAIANMAVIDDVYRAAGLPVREPSIPSG